MVVIQFAECVENDVIGIVAPATMSPDFLCST